MEKRVLKSNFYLPLLLLFILADILCDNSIFRAINKESPITQLSIFIGISLLQTIAAPIQAGLSDSYCRKISLIIALAFSLLALIFQYVGTFETFFFFPLVIIMVLSKGVFGNTIPLAWAAIADTQEKNVRFSFALSTGAFAAAYLLLIFANKLFSIRQSAFIMILYFSALILLCALFFKDIRDHKIHEQKIPTDSSTSNKSKIKLLNFIYCDIKLILNELKYQHTRNALLAFLLWEISLYSILLLYVDFELSEFSIIAIGMVCGYLFGVLVLKFCDRISDNLIIKIGYNISAISLVPFFIVYMFSSTPNFTLLSACYFLHMMGNAFLSATLFSILAKERKPHEQGKIYGLIESVDTVAFLVSSIAAIAYNASHINLIYIIAFSFLAVSISWFPYAKFEKTRPRERRS
jgi:MFS family permease